MIARFTGLHGHGRENEKNLLCFVCDFSGWYNFGKIINIVATRCHILKLKCTKFDFGWGSAPDHSPDLPAGFKLAYLKGKCLQCFDAVGWATGRASGL